MHQQRAKRYTEAGSESAAMVACHLHDSSMWESHVVSHVQLQLRCIVLTMLFPDSLVSNLPQLLHRDSVHGDGDVGMPGLVMDQDSQ